MIIEKIFDMIEGRVLEGEGARLLSPYDVEMRSAGVVHTAMRQRPDLKEKILQSNDHGCPLRSGSICDIREIICTHQGSQYECKTYRIAISHLPDM